MSRIIGVGSLIFCFGLSSVNIVSATQVIEVPPIIVQPYDVSDLREISQQMLNQDRINRDQELAIRGLIDDNQKLTITALASQQDATLEKINQTMVKYRDAILSRDRARIFTNEQKVSKYYDLINLTEDVDDMKGVGVALQLKSNVIEQKYKILTELKDEMVALNEKLKEEALHESPNKTTPEQSNRVQILTQRLAEMDKKISHYDEILAEKDRQIVQLKSEVTAKDEVIKQEENQIAVLTGQSQALSSKENLIKSQADQMAKVSEQFKDQNFNYANIHEEVLALKSKIQQQDIDLKARDESIRWLNQVVQAAKNKAKYYKLTSQEDRMSLEQVQKAVQQIKDDFALRFKNYDHFETAIASLKNQVSQLGLQLTQKQSQVDLLKSELENKITEENNQAKLKQGQAADDRLKLAYRLIELQRNQAVLLEEKNRLNTAQNAGLEDHARNLDNKINGLLANQQTQKNDFENRMEELQNILNQKGHQVELLKIELENKISQEKSQGVLDVQIHDLKGQLQDKENQITALKAKIQSGQETQAQADTFKQQLAEEQNKVELLKQELESKILESKKMTLMMKDYQKKLESKDNSNNEQLGQILSSKNHQVKLEKQIADLNIRLQEKEAQVVRVKKDMYDLQESASTKDLNASMVQQKMMDKKVSEYQDKIHSLQAASNVQELEIKNLKTDLALARQQLSGMPSSDEIGFLRSDLKKATIQLKQKEEMLAQTKANAQEYKKEFQEQSMEFQSLKEQLQDAYDEINHKNEDLKYKNLELIRLKERSAVKEGELQDQVRLMTRQMKSPGKNIIGMPHGNKPEDLKLQLMNANLQIKDLQTQLNQFILFTKNDPLRAKLKQALDKIDEQGRLINVLSQKLQDSGNTVDLTQYSSKK